MEDRSVSDTQLPLLAVLDGESEGGVAAEIAAETLLGAKPRGLGSDANTAVTRLTELLQIAHRRIIERAVREAWSIGGTTCTVCTVLGDVLVAAHVGDSRLYVERDGYWHRVTRDHSLREDQEGGNQPGNPELLSELSTVVTRALGVGTPLRIDSYVVPVNGSLALMLCTDGAWRPLDPFGLPKTIPFDRNLADGARSILAVHRQDGARDDATVLMAPLVGAG
jgi:protein phosphatase